MNQKKIKFSHLYIKMPFDGRKNFEVARIMEVFIAEKKDLSDEFVEYDTSYYMHDYLTNDMLVKHNYPLPDGKLIVLLLQSINSSGIHMWTTVRRWTPQKEKYYRSIRGQTVEIVLPDVNRCQYYVEKDKDKYKVKLNINEVSIK